MYLPKISNCLGVTLIQLSVSVKLPEYVVKLLRQCLKWLGRGIHEFVLPTMVSLEKKSAVQVDFSVIY